MTSYRARVCPECHYYLGYAVRPLADGTSEAPLRSFCLNCNYQLPVRAVVRGKKNSLPVERQRRTAAFLRRRNDCYRPASLSAAAQSQEKTRAQPSNYRRDLRAIGQALEKRQYTTFNLKCSDDGYFVWSTETVEPSHLGLSSITKGEIVASASGGDGAVKMLVDRIVGFQCSGGDIERLDREGTQNRRRRIGVADGRGLSQLLRTLGDQLLRRNQRLLAIAWHERWIGVVTETAGRRREINVLRTDNLYDLWVRMYLQRSH